VECASGCPVPSGTPATEACADKKTGPPKRAELVSQEALAVLVLLAACNFRRPHLT
jgi:hypothetical protein